MPPAFFFGLGRFKGSEGLIDLEVYYGIPTRDLTFVENEDGESVASLKRGVALYNEANEPMHRLREEMALYAEGPIDTTKMAFVPELDRISLSPGTYRMSVQVLDQASAKSQVYNQQVTIEPYDQEDLKLSDIELAASIRPGKVGKFSKRGIEVVPNPSLAYLPGQPVYIYYEVYNLKKDEFGATKYRVSYEVKSLEKKQVQADILSALGKLLGMREEAEAITIEYEHLGDQEDDYGYLELDMSNTDAGEQILKVRITEESSGQSAVAFTTFTIR